MRDLNELQKTFQAYLMQHHPAIENHITHTHQVSASERLDIYREAYYGRLIESLAKDYPTIHKILGDDEFHHLCRQYIDRYPSTFKSIRWFGAHFATCLMDCPLYLNQRWLKELAEFEWCLSEAFDAANSVTMTVQEMASIPAKCWPNLCFTCHPSLRRLTFQSDICKLWHQVNEKNIFITPKKTKKQKNCLIWRKGYDVKFCYLHQTESYMIDMILQGSNFSDICEGLCEFVQEDEVVVCAATILKQFMMDELITHIQIN